MDWGIPGRKAHYGGLFLIWPIIPFDGYPVFTFQKEPFFTQALIWYGGFHFGYPAICGVYFHNDTFQTFSKFARSIKMYNIPWLIHETKIANSALRFPIMKYHFADYGNMVPLWPAATNSGR